MSSTKTYSRHPNVLEGPNFTVFSMGPLGVDPIHEFLNSKGIQNIKAYVNPAFYPRVVEKFPIHDHIAILADPVKRHMHSAAVYKQYCNDPNRVLTTSDFYKYHLYPHMNILLPANIQFILFDELKDYIGDLEFTWREGIQLFSLEEEVNSYIQILKSKQKVSVERWNNILSRWQ